MLEDVKSWNIHVDRIELLGGMSYCKVFRDYVLEKINEEGAQAIFISFFNPRMKLLHDTLRK